MDTCVKDLIIDVVMIIIAAVIATFITYTIVDSHFSNREFNTASKNIEVGALL